MKWSLAVSIGLCGGVAIGLEAQGRMPDVAAALVVQVLAYAQDEAEANYGAGIVLGASNRVIIATAAHVVLPAAVGGRVLVVFHGRQGDTLLASIDQLDQQLDLAVLSLPGTVARGLRFDFAREGDPSALELGAPVYAVGCPQNICWQPPVSPERLILGNDRRVTFESYSVEPGSSGGALFNSFWEVIGLVTEMNDPRGTAISIRHVRDRLRQWGYTGQLHRKRVPRAGYATRISLAGIAPTSGGLFQSGRVPGGRATVLFRGQHRIGWHVSGLRLAPENLVVSAGLVGVDLRLQAGPLAFVPFGEFGFGRVEGRFDAGGFFVQGANGPKYRPFWNQQKDDILGIGGGATVEVLLVPHIAVEGTVAHWDFRAPGNLESLPALFAGAGLRFAF